MITQATTFGVQFDAKSREEILPAADAPGHVALNPATMAHESLKGLWWIAEYLPKRI
jgi:hypothetical protein